MNVYTLPLFDGPLCNVATMRRGDLVQRMAADLVRLGTAQGERDAIRSLFGCGYAMADIVMLIDEARALAFQEIVAAEMSKP
jgi:hypothetical protein